MAKRTILNFPSFQLVGNLEVGTSPKHLEPQKTSQAVVLAIGSPPQIEPSLCVSNFVIIGLDALLTANVGSKDITMDVGTLSVCKQANTSEVPADETIKDATLLLLLIAHFHRYHHPNLYVVVIFKFACTLYQNTFY